MTDERRRFPLPNEPDSDYVSVRVRPWPTQMYTVCLLSRPMREAWDSWCESVAWAADTMLRDARTITRQMDGTMNVPEDIGIGEKAREERVTFGDEEER